MIIIGIDSGLKSPGIALFQQDRWYLYAFSQWKRTHKHFYHDMISLFPAVPTASSSTFKRYSYVTDCIITIIQEAQTQDKDVRVVMEGYAFQCHQGHMAKTYELGGILKYRIQKECGVPIVSLPPLRWKKWALGYGVADKATMVNFIKTHGPCLDLFDIFQLKLSKSGEVPKPVQDLADASCIVLAYIGFLDHPEWDKKKVKKSRTQTSKETTPEKKNKKQKREVPIQKQKSSTKRRKLDSVLIPDSAYQ